MYLLVPKAQKAEIFPLAYKDHAEEIFGSGKNQSKNLTSVLHLCGCGKSSTKESHLCPVPICGCGKYRT